MPLILHLLTEAITAKHGNWYLGEFLDDFMSHGIVTSVGEYFANGYFIEERIQFADKI